MSRVTAMRSEGLVAAQNALRLGTSLALTTGVALLVRLLVPRRLGPSAFGELRLAESAAEMLFVVLTFGVDMQLRREAAVDASSARRYLSGLTVLRFGLGGVAIAGGLLALRATGASTTLLWLFGLTATAQVLLVLNNSYGALEHAVGDVSWLARTNFATKAVWGGGMVAVLLGHPRGILVAGVGLAVEATRFAWMTFRVRTRHAMDARPDLRLATGAILASFPFFVNNVAHNFYARVGIGWLGAVSSESEVGLYSAAANLATIALLGMPLLSWVLVPSAARAGAASREELDGLFAGALRVSLLLAVPVTVVCHYGAGFLLGLLFGQPYLAAAPILRILAPTFGLAYVSTVCAIALLQDGRAWTVASISLAGLVVTVGLDASLIPWGARTLGAAGGAQGAAWATLATEVLVTLALVAVGRKSWLEAKLRRTAGALACGVGSIAAALALAPWSGLAAGCAAGTAFIAAVAGFGGVTLEDVRFARQVVGSLRRPQTSVPVPEAA